MKNKMKTVFALVAPVLALGFFVSCASTSHCNTDACYDRQISSVDAYKRGNIAAWGSEKEMAQQEEERGAKVNRLKKRAGSSSVYEE